MYFYIKKKEQNDISTYRMISIDETNLKTYVTAFY